jgi:hypothetical protein
MLGWGILGVIAWVLVAIWPARIASKKGYSFVLWFILSLFFWWITLFVAAFGLKDKTKTAQDIADEKAVDEIMARELK